MKSTLRKEEDLSGSLQTGLEVLDKAFVPKSRGDYVQVSARLSNAQREAFELLRDKWLKGKSVSQIIQEALLLRAFVAHQEEIGKPLSTSIPEGGKKFKRVPDVAKHLRLTNSK